MNNKKVMLITGTRKGIGRYLSEYYVDNGYEVIGCSRGPIDFELQGYEHFQLDIANEDQVRKMFYSIRKKHGGLDILINNAGVASMNHFLLTGVDTYEKLFSTNVLGTFLCCREAAKLMKKRPYGRIVNMGSVATPFKLEGEALYGASKAAIVNLSQIIAFELAPFNITVNTLGPSAVKTDLTSGINEDNMQRMFDRQAIKRYAEFSEVSNVIDFFISEKSGHVTGQVIYLGGV